MTVAKISTQKSAPFKKNMTRRLSLALVDENTSKRRLLTPPARRATVSPPVVEDKPRVRFAPMVEVTARSVTDDDLRNSWYSGEEYRLFENGCRQTVSLIRSAKAAKESGNSAYHLNAEDITACGLEDFVTVSAKELRDYRKALHNHHVLKEQYTQRCQGVKDGESLAAVAELYAAESCLLAFQRGMSKSY